MCFMMLDGGGKLFNGLLYIPAIYFVFTELMRRIILYSGLGSIEFYLSTNDRVHLV